MNLASRLRYLFLSFASSVLFFQVSCETTEVDYSHLEQDPESFGYRMGRADALAGRDYDYERYLDRLHPDVDEEDFEDAYDDAYEEGEEELEEREEAREDYYGEAYDDGYARGEIDRDRGLSRDPYRHDVATSGSSRFTDAWVDGYRDGWNND